MANLKSPLEIKGLFFKNRLVLPPIATDTCVDGKPTEKTYLNYRDYALAGVGTVIVEHNYIDLSGRFSIGQMAIDSDKFQQERIFLAQEIKTNAAVSGLQITHAGSGTKQTLTGTVTVAPSAIAHPTSGEMPREISNAEIKVVIAKFVEAALRVKSAGFDFIEIHAAHGYLLNEFYSPLTNKRQDEYGGNSEKRLRLLLEVTQQVRKAVGQEFTLFMRLGAVDLMEGGNQESDAAFAAQHLVEAGIDVLDISGGFCGSRPLGMVQGHFVPAALSIRKAVEIPVMVTGGITEPQYADSLVREGKVDLVGVARALIKDKEWAKKALT